MSGFDFSEVAARYATYRPRYPAELAAALAGRGAERELAWDVGCGSGQLTASLAPHFARVIATDPAQAQLAVAPRLANVEYRCAPAEASGLPAACADLVVAAQAAHWFDWPAFVAEVRRVAKPGALAAAISYGVVEVAGAPSVARYYHETLAGFWTPERRHVENGYRELRWPWPELPPPELAMRADWTRDEFVGYVTTWSATARLVREHPDRFTVFREALARDWPGGEPRAIAWPLTVRACRVEHSAGARR